MHEAAALLHGNMLVRSPIGTEVSKEEKILCSDPRHRHPLQNGHSYVAVSSEVSGPVMAERFYHKVLKLWKPADGDTQNKLH